jgi:uncharacterized protein (TIGR03437 family)
LLLPLLNDATGLQGAPSGGTISISATGVPTDVRGWSVIIDGNRGQVTRTDDGRLLAPIAPGIAAGPRSVQLVPTSGPAVPPVLFQVDAAPPVITLVGAGAPGLAVAAQPRLHPGDKLALIVSNLLIPNPGDNSTPTSDDVEVRVGSVALHADLIVETTPGSGIYRVEFVIPASAPTGDSEPVSVRVGTRLSASITVAIDPLP